MDARFERYVENLRTVRTLSQPKFSPDMKAKELLETIQAKGVKIGYVTLHVGLGNLSYFIRLFRQRYGQTLKQYQLGLTSRKK